MKTTLTRESGSKVRLSVEASADEVAPAIGRAVKTLAGQVKIPGFRAGKAPRKILESRIGRDAIREQTLKEAIPELLGKAVEEHDDIAPIAPPSVYPDDITYDLDGDLSFAATVEVLPEIPLPNPELLTATRPSGVATDDEIDEQLGRLQDRYATLETVERAASRGDYASLDIHGSAEGQPIEALSGTDQLYEIGSAWPVAELDTNLEAKKAGDIVEFSAVLPEELGGEWAGKAVSFRVLVKDVRRKVTPALDDEFATTASEFETLDELRADLAERIGKVKSIQADGEVRNQILEQIVDDVEFEPPLSLIHQEMAYRLQRLEEQLQQAGMSLQDYLSSQEQSEEDLEADLRRQAERNIRAQLILEEVGRTEGFQVTEDELREEVRRNAESLRIDPGELAKQLTERGRLAALAGDIIRRKALNLLVERADIKEEAPQEAVEAPAPAAEEE